MQFTDIGKTKDLIHLNSKNFTMQYQHPHSIQVTFPDNFAKNVPLYKAMKRDNSEKDIPHCEVRLALVNMSTKNYISNFYIFGAKAIKEKPTKK